MPLPLVRNTASALNDDLVEVHVYMQLFGVPIPHLKPQRVVIDPAILGTEAGQRRRSQQKPMNALQLRYRNPRYLRHTTTMGVFRGHDLRRAARHQ